MTSCLRMLASVHLWETPQGSFDSLVFLENMLRRVLCVGNGENGRLPLLLGQRWLVPC